MQVSTSAYYQWLKIPQDSDKYQQDQKVAEKAKQIFIDNKQCFGSRRLADRLQKQGFAVGRFKMRRIMRDLKLLVRYPKRFKVTTDSNHNEAISPNRLDRQFQVAKPNQVWTTDITYVWTLQGWLYVAVVIDLFSRQVVGWAIDDHIPTGHKCARHCASRHCKWLSGVANPRRVCYIIRIVAASMRVGNIVSI
ncbi:hypothetical protein C2U68_18735 [Methylomonas koyamae]|nr:hypothetical protein C2U68_18735 [Methylomonas koyamae]